MAQKTHAPVPPPVPQHAPQPVQTDRHLQQPEPLEVLGRHKNSGQKDHKGAR